MSGRGARRDARLALLRVAGASRSGPVRSYPPRSVLLIRPDHLGDVLLLTPALHALRSALPAARLTLLLGPWSAAAVAGNSDVDAIETLPFPGFERKPKGNLLAPYRLLFEAAARLKGRFDTAVVLRYDHWWGAWLAMAAGIPHRIGYDWPETRAFLTEAVPYEAGRHEALQNARLLEALAPETGWELGPARYTVEENDRQWAAARLDRWERERGVARTVRVAIHPGAGAAVKQWPVERWAEVADTLAARAGAEIILTGGANEAALTSGINTRIGQSGLNLAGETSFGQLAAVYQVCDLVLGSDSGPLHLAVAAGASTVHLHGPVPAAKFGPWGDPARNLVIGSRFLCAPCDRLDWPHDALGLHGCMAAIDPQQVIDAALRLIRSNL